jgi:hypothetical protein
MDFISENFLNREDMNEKELQTILRSGIPQEFFKEHISETAAETSCPREVILSEYLIC